MIPTTHLYIFIALYQKDKYFTLFSVSFHIFPSHFKEILENGINYNFFTQEISPMKPSTAFLASCLFFSAVCAENCPQPDCCEPVCCQPTYCCELVYCTNNRLMAGVNYSRVHLKAKGESLFKGNLGGAHALYEHIRENGFYAGLEFDWRQGQTHGSDGCRFLIDFNTDERFGYTWTR